MSLRGIRRADSEAIFSLGILRLLRPPFWRARNDKWILNKVVLGTNIFLSLFMLEGYFFHIAPGNVILLAIISENDYSSV